MTNTYSRFSRFAVGALLGFLLICAIVAGTVYAGSVVKKNDLIDEQTAEEFAVLDAGAESGEISNIRTKLEYKHGQYEYDIIFNIGNTKYEYAIRAKDGSVISKESKEIANISAESSKNPSLNADQIDQQTETDKEALDQTPDQADAKAANSHTAAEPQIYAVPQTAAAATHRQPANHISVDQAKKTALDHAGLSESEVRFSSAKLENDDGKYEYDIEFYKDQTEYEYEIDAITGEIINYDAESD